VRAAFDETGLVVAGLHVFDEDVSDAEGRRHVLAAARGIGAPRVLLTAHTLLRAGADTAAFREVAQLLEGLVVDAAPIAVYHHPHDVDFRPLPDDPARCGLDVVLAEAPRVSVALDLYWAHMGGAEPAAMVRRLRERCDYVHVRDGVGRRTTPLGDGEVALDAALAELRDAATAPGWLVYEDATPRLPPIASCRAARSFLAARGFGARSLLSGSRQ
jgi:sugar phosphate isomerase/epimerase